NRVKWRTPSSSDTSGSAAELRRRRFAGIAARPLPRSWEPATGRLAPRRPGRLMSLIRETLIEKVLGKLGGEDSVGGCELGGENLLGCAGIVPDVVRRVHLGRADENAVGQLREETSHVEAADDAMFVAKATKEL